MIWNRSSSAWLAKMEAATTYQQWAEYALELDRQSGGDDWRHSEVSSQYDYRSVRQRLEHLRGLRARKDYAGLMFALNEGIHGNLAGMGRAELYGRARMGTKRLIHDYIEEVCQALEALSAVDDKSIGPQQKEDFFQRASHCFGRSALMLSGGAALGFFHAGVIKALLAENLLPSIISGSSAGSIIAAITCTHLDEELPEKLSAKRIAMHSEHGAKARKDKGDRRTVGTQELVEYLARVIPDLTFEEAYRLTGRKLNVTVTGLAPRQAPRLLNAITAPNVMIRSAVQASCALYGLFPPVTLTAKNAAGEQVAYLPEQQWIDGSYVDDLPAKRLGRLYGVNHFISSMVNPAALLFTPNPDARQGLVQSVVNLQVKWTKSAATQLLQFSRRHLRTSNPTLSRWQHLSYNVLAQEYTADINIFLAKRWHNPLKLMAPLPLAEVEQLVREGKQQTWERMEMVRNCTAISRTLDTILQRHHWSA
ncbi:patatin-like phospholipase family protein [Pseudomonas sp. CAN2814]|uniref:patatin-like phospholipase family protein n=1 Tax=Pseudomonas sp. CAN1 TaxID=3046726 RepID=UPI002647F82B|nr:patatin-like phospholipase family protein [Pseudomonas sp. CAN1]MDN6860956.1 patatin-like phospholipase family protein [Pseudomonas sp. CAN1]